MQAETKIEKIKRLKQAKARALQNNEQQVEVEKRRRRLESLKTTQPKDGSENSDEVQATKESKNPRNNMDEKSKLLSYTIEDTDRWNTTKKAKKYISEAPDFNEIAAMTYLKETEGLEIDQEVYQRQKKLLTEKYQIPENDQVQVLEYLRTQKPDPSLIKKLKHSYDQNHQRKMNRKRGRNVDNEDSAYISRKNKDFNMKLNREYQNKS